MQLAIGLVLLALFLVGVVIIMRGQSPIVVLLALAILWPAVTGTPLNEILNNVLQKGAESYASAVVIIIFGAWFGQVLVQTGIAESIIRSAVELAGDRPVMVAIVISLVTGFLFTSMYGVGAAIAIGVIALPIMMSMGVPPRVAAPAFTMAIGAGNYMNLVVFNIFKPLFPGIQYQEYFGFYVTGFLVYLACACAMSFVNLQLVGARKYSSVAVAPPVERARVPWYAYLTPLVPVAVVILLQWPMVPAFMLGIVVALGLTWNYRSFRGAIDLFHKAFYDAFPDIATIAALWIICGMMILAGQLPQVQAALKPIFGPILPGTALATSIFFAVLAPLAIYRGPFSVVGTGAALLAIFLGAKTINPVYLYLVWLGPLMMQGSQDPTNSWTLWTIGYTKISHKDFLRTAVPWGWLMVAVNAFIAYFMYGNLVG